MPFAPVGKPKPVAPVAPKPSAAVEPVPVPPVQSIPAPMGEDDDGLHYRTWDTPPSGWRNAPARKGGTAADRLDIPSTADAASLPADAVVTPESLSGAALAAVDLAGQSVPDDVQRMRARGIAAGLVQDIATRADAAARTAIPTMTDGQAALVWSDVLELLEAEGLEPVIYCARSGRRLGDIDPLPWRDHLTAIHGLGSSQVADKALMRLVTAVTALAGNTVAPPLLVTSQEANALLRELHPVDFVMSGLSRLIGSPPDKGPDAQSLTLAKRAQMLGALRRDCEKLSRPVVEYLAECLTLYLAHVTPRRVPYKHSALAFYDLHGWRGCLASPGAVSHLCNRLVLTLWQLIQARRIRPSAHITLADMRGLSVHWGGLVEYRNQKAMRAVLRGAGDRFRLDIAGANPMTGKGGVRLDQGQVAGLGAAALGFDLAELLDMQSALRMTGRKVPIAVASPVEHETLTKRRADIERMARALFVEDDNTVTEIDMTLDLSAIAVSGQLDEAFNAVEYDNPLDLMGFEGEDDFFAMLYQDNGDDVPDQDDDEGEALLGAGGFSLLDTDHDDDEGTALDLAGASLADALSGGGRAKPAKPSPFSASVSDLQASALEKAIREARPVGLARLRPMR